MKLKALGLIAVGLLAGPMAASANNIYDWSYTDGGSNTGSGTFDTSSTGNPYTVLSVTGVADGNTITGLSLYAGADNLLYDPGTANPGYVDFGGISFTTTGDTYNIGGSYTPGQYVLNDSGLDPSGYPYPAAGSYVIQFSVSEVPEPATLGLLGAGLAGVGLMRRRKKV